MEPEVQRLLEKLPGKDCGQCGFKTCAELARYAATHPDVLRRCIYLERPLEPGPPPAAELHRGDITWKDVLGREYDFVLEPFPEDPGPRETILPFNPANIQRLGIKKGDVLFGRPAWVGCPVTHVGLVMEDPDPLNGAIVWCVVGPLAARERGIEIGEYNPVAYEGIVRFSRAALQIGARYHFLPYYCMLQSRHSAVVSALAKRSQGMRVRLEGIWID
ncbi:MAG: Fe-S cluster protein [Gammaproteobacteria bacterium]|nr:Fe-S cluster protein [Gammaproteobacteria bacterium]NIR98769.1 Fe-S cluster protein [Gammaproteobacteria bacterium]NIT64479.1 Fe-S cluster protein [Gammaproteobacteria bacterium]NIV21399.1 Fe-S cluster protein [Gammaproteobacteria bacterium]NIX11269.1 Fe-S cluster protein [Gammaproteobacteria bacterium]